MKKRFGSVVILSAILISLWALGNPAYGALAYKDGSMPGPGVDESKAPASDGFLQKMLQDMLHDQNFTSRVASPLLQAGFANPEARPDESTPEYVPGEIIVKLKGSPGPAGSSRMSSSMGNAFSASSGIQELEGLNSRFGAKGMGKVFNDAKPRASGLNMMAAAASADAPDLSRIYKVEFGMDADIESLIQEYRQNPAVEYAEPNYIYHTFAIPDDARFGEQWALDQASDHDIDATEAWDIEKGNESTIIAIIDTGVQWDHPDLAANIWNNTDEIPNNGIDDDNNNFIDDVRGWDFVDNATTIDECIDIDCENEDNNPMDGSGHGTHCAGIAAAVTGNGVGVAGVCPNCRIMPVRAGFKVGDTGALKNDDIAEAIIYAAYNGADVISMSFGGSEDASIIYDAVEYAYSKGVILVASAGNNYGDVKNYPAAYEKVISVSSTTSTDGKSYFSNYGYWVDVAAPGSDILSTYINNDYKTLSGTSMACPHVVGLVGLILSKKNSNFNQEEVRKIIKSSVEPISTDKYMGFGRINAHQALQIDSVPSSVISSPSVEDVISNGVDIFGTASGINFANYSLMYGNGIYPASWTVIYESSTQVPNGKLGTLDTTALEDGIYTIRLLVYNADGWSEDRVLVRVLNQESTCFSCDDCSYKIENKTNVNEFTLNNDIHSNGSCIDLFDRDDIVFECNGFNISGSASGYGFYVSGSKNVTIRNCEIDDFEYGIFIDTSEKINLSSNNMNGNRKGLAFDNSNFLNYYDHSIDTSNLVNGRPVHYYFGIMDEVIDLGGSQSGHLDVAFSYNITLIGSDVYSDGIRLIGVTDSLIKDNKVTDAENGIYIDSDSVGNNFTGNTITKDIADKIGFYFEYTTSLQNTMDQSNTVNSEPMLLFFNVSGTKASPIAPAPMVLDEPNTTNMGKVMIYGSDYVKISGFTISNNVFGIYMRDSDNGNLSYNQISNSQGGIGISYSNSNTVTGNTLNGNSLIGIYSDLYSANNTFRGNDVSGTQNCRLFNYILFDLGGIGANGDNNTIDANNLSGNGCFGVSVSGNGNVVSGNTIQNNMGGIYLSGTGHSISNNAISKAADDYGIFIPVVGYSLHTNISSSNTVDGEQVYYFNELYRPAGSPMIIDSVQLNVPNVTNVGKITLVNVTNFNITNSRISNNDYGIYIYDSTNVSVTGSEISGTSMAGVISQYSLYTQITRCNITESRYMGVYLADFDPFFTTRLWENNIINARVISVYSDWPVQLSYQNSGNFWGRTDPPYFIARNDSNEADVNDSYPYGRMSGWLDDTPPSINFVAPTIPDWGSTNINWIFINVSADENLTQCTLEWLNSSTNYTMSVKRDNERTLCYLNVTAQDSGWYYFRVYANDTAYNWNATGIMHARLNGPPNITYASVLPHLLLNGESLTINASATDPDNVSSLYYRIYNNTQLYSAPMQKSGSDYWAIYTPSLSAGKYNVSIFANDTFGAYVDTPKEYFEVQTSATVNLTIRDYAGNPMNMSLGVFSPADSFIRRSEANITKSVFPVPKGKWNLNLTSGFSIILREINFTQATTGYVDVDDVPVSLVTPPEHRQFSKIIGVSTNFNFSLAQVVIPYKGLIQHEDRIIVYRCANWSLSGRNCIGGDWGNKLTLNTHYTVDTSRDIITINTTGFSAYASGEEVPYCGNGIIDDTAERCDGGNLNDQTCGTLGLGSGSLGCTSSCLFDTSGCSIQTPGDYDIARLEILNVPSLIDIAPGAARSLTPQVRNSGTINLTNVVLSASATCSECQISLSPAGMNLSAGETGNFNLNLTISSSQANGNYTLNVTARSSQSPGISRLSTISVRQAATICAPGSKRCSVTGYLLKCSNDGASWLTDQNCPNGCESGACKTICNASEKKCAGNKLLQCKTDGSGWNDLKTCDSGCDSSALDCNVGTAGGPAEDEKRCNGTLVQQYLGGRWVTVENCTGTCENATCSGGPLFAFDFGPWGIIIVIVVIFGGLGFYLYRTQTAEPGWEDLEHKWEIIRTSSSQVLRNPQVFLNKKVRLTGKITESAQDETGVIGSTLVDSDGEILVFSNPPGPSGWVTITGLVTENEMGEICLEAESIEKSILWFLERIKSIFTR